jgi:adenylate cyclase class IV
LNLKIKKHISHNIYCMLEIESKILEINEKEIIEKLEKMDYKDKKEKKLISLLYDTKEDSIVEKGGVVRLRFNGEKGYLTIKSPIRDEEGKIVCYEEDEKEINFDEKEKEFRNTHILILKTEKIRKTYVFDDCLIEIDTYKENLNFIPTFLEIEALNEETILRRARELGFEERDLRKMNTLELIKKYSST